MQSTEYRYSFRDVKSAGPPQESCAAAKVRIPTPDTLMHQSSQLMPMTDTASVRLRRLGTVEIYSFQLTLTDQYETFNYNNTTGCGKQHSFFLVDVL